MKNSIAQTKGSSRSSNSFCLREANVARGQALPPREDMVNDRPRQHHIRFYRTSWLSYEAASVHTLGLGFARLALHVATAGPVLQCGQHHQ